jgi:hypothetical protein
METARKLFEFSTFEDYDRYIKEQQHIIEEKKHNERALKANRAARLNDMKRMSVMSVGTLLVFCMAMLMNASVFRAQYDNSVLKKGIKEMKVQIADTKTQLEDAKILKNIETVAIQELGMQYPESKQIVYIKSNYGYKLSKR